ncbi:MAG: hypothetical protein C4550_07230 [Nitrospiraceae bacterium]|nr:MAG: hypothetical protein C4550_07230 [Nitrospiraceae bacterium]
MDEPKDTDNKLKRLFYCYVLSGLFIFISLSGVIISTRYKNHLSGALKDLQAAKQNLFTIQGAAADMDSIMAGMDRIMTPDITTQAAEMQLLISLDGLKSGMKEAEITVSPMEYKGDEVSLPVIVRAPLKDYADFVNKTGHLQSRKFPVFNISRISLSQTPDKAVYYEIAGDIRTLKGKKK